MIPDQLKMCTLLPVDVLPRCLFYFHMFSLIGHHYVRVFHFDFKKKLNEQKSLFVRRLIYLVLRSFGCEVTTSSRKFMLP